MTFTLRSAAFAVVGGAAVAVLPLTVATVATPAPSRAACEVGQMDGCSPLCPEGQLLDTKSSECLDVMSAVARQLPASPEDLPAAQLPPMPDVGTITQFSAPNFAVPNVGIPNVGIPNIGIPGVGLPLPPLGLPSLPEPPKLPPPPPLLCGPEINTPIPFVGFKPCL
jgi:hypothetical protein